MLIWAETVSRSELQHCNDFEVHLETRNHPHPLTPYTPRVSHAWRVWKSIPQQFWFVHTLTVLHGTQDSKANLRMYFYFKTLFLKEWTFSKSQRGNHSGKANRRENVKREIIKDDIHWWGNTLDCASEHKSSHVTVTHRNTYRKTQWGHETVPLPTLSSYVASLPHHSFGFDE